MRCAVILAFLVGRAAAQPADWAPQRSAFDPQVAARYEQMLARDPFDDATLAKLARMVKADDLEHQLAEDPAGFIVRARLHRKDRAGATGFYLRALERDPHGPFAARTWFALAELDRDRGDSAAARAAYAQVLTASPPRPLARRALTELAALAAVANDPRADDYFAQLIALSPADPELWLARGDALVATTPERAAECFAQAEKLIRDPQHRLDAIARRGDALAKAHESAAAIAEYRRAIALAPKGYYLVAELVARIVDVARADHALPAIAGELEAAWPERTRGYLEWSTLADLYLEVRTAGDAIAAYERAVRLAPWELATQRKLIALLAANGRDPKDQLRAAIRAAPSEPSLQLDLAKRTWPDPAALVQLDQTARQFARDGSVLDAVARQFIAFGRPDRAEKWLEALARLEPDDVSHWLALTSAYFAADNHRGAIEAWKRVAREQPGAKLEFANALLGERDNHSALRLVDEAIALDSLNPEAWRLRATAHEQLGDLHTAIIDALREVALTPPDPAALRHARHHVVQLVVRARPDPEDWVEGDDAPLDLFTQYTNEWHDAFWADPADVQAGYLYVELVTEHVCATELLVTCEDAHASVLRLEHLVPDDLGVLRTEIQMLETSGQHHAAAERLEKLLAVAPMAERDRIEEHIRRERLQLDFSIHHLSLDHIHDDDLGTVDGPARPRTWGLGLAIDYGATLRGTGGGSIGLGGYVRYLLGEPTDEGAANGVEARLDWSKGGDGNGGGGAAFGIWHLFAPLSAASVSAGLDQRLAFSAGTAQLASAAGVVFALHEAPLELGLRMEQTYVGGLDTRGLLEVRVRLY